MVALVLNGIPCKLGSSELTPRKLNGLVKILSRNIVHHTLNGITVDFTFEFDIVLSAALTFSDKTCVCSIEIIKVVIGICFYWRSGGMAKKNFINNGFPASNMGIEIALVPAGADINFRIERIDNPPPIRRVLDPFLPSKRPYLAPFADLLLVIEVYTMPDEFHRGDKRYVR